VHCGHASACMLCLATSCAVSLCHNGAACVCARVCCRHPRSRHAASTIAAAFRRHRHRTRTFGARVLQRALRRHVAAVRTARRVAAAGRAAAWGQRRWRGAVARAHHRVRVLRWHAALRLQAWARDRARARALATAARLLVAWLRHRAVARWRARLLASTAVLQGWGRAWCARRRAVRSRVAAWVARVWRARCRRRQRATAAVRVAAWCTAAWQARAAAAAAAAAAKAAAVRASAVAAARARVCAWLWRCRLVALAAGCVRAASLAAFRRRAQRYLWATRTIQAWWRAVLDAVEWPEHWDGDGGNDGNSSDGGDGGGGSSDACSMGSRSGGGNGRCEGSHGSGGVGGGWGTAAAWGPPVVPGPRRRPASARHGLPGCATAPVPAPGEGAPTWAPLSAPGGAAGPRPRRSNARAGPFRGGDRRRRRTAAGPAAAGAGRGDVPAVAPTGVVGSAPPPEATPGKRRPVGRPGARSRSRGRRRRAAPALSAQLLGIHPVTFNVMLAHGSLSGNVAPPLAAAGASPAPLKATSSAQAGRAADPLPLVAAADGTGGGSDGGVVNSSGVVSDSDGRGGVGGGGMGPNALRAWGAGAMPALLGAPQAAPGPLLRNPPPAALWGSVPVHAGGGPLVLYPPVTAAPPATADMHPALQLFPRDRDGESESAPEDDDVPSPTRHPREPCGGC
jgi:hypothetical protein